ncbi:MAG: glycosyltransferase family 4 protein [bacterium]|nr:glycosyltransferase family 4 protein [bacterium]
MRILFDHQIFARQKRGGITRYFSELIKHLRDFPHANTSLSVVYSDTIYLKDSGVSVTSAESLSQKSDIISYIKNLVKSHKSAQYLYTYFKNSVNKRKSIKDLENQEFDIFHPTFFDPYFLTYIKSKPFVITVHDMMHELFPDLFSNSAHVSKNKKELSIRASRVIAITEHTKQDLIKLFSIDPSKIDVIHHGTSLSAHAMESIDVPSSYILFVGGRASYKNFSFFIKAIAPLLIKYDISLVCIGGDTFRNHEIELFDSLAIKQKAVQLTVSDNQLAYIYSRALCFVFPSLYEGFGMPILEAFACNCPVVLSNTSCFPEIAGNAGEYFDPHNAQSIYTALEKVMTSDIRREELRICGTKRLANFSWHTTAEKTLQTYTKCLEHAND